MDTDKNLEFDWDEEKAHSNLTKHGISFEEAASAFQDDFALIYDDEYHSDDEPREILIGMSSENHILFISFTEIQSRLIRIISARYADRHERKRYENEPRF